MKKLILIGLVIISALSFAGKGGGNGSGGSGNSSGGNIDQQQREINIETREESRITTQTRIQEPAELGIKKQMKTQTQQRIHLSIEDRDKIMKKENSKSLNFRKSMEKKYGANWDEIEDAARRVE